MPGESKADMKVDITDLYMTAPAFAQAGSLIADAVQQATSQLEGRGNFWGNDEAGRKFGAVYGPDQAKLLQLLAIVAGEVSGIADGINKMADTYQIANDATINKIRALNQEMP